MAYKKSTETRKKIIDTATKLFNEKGYYDTNIKDIAREANIVHSSIYYYFKNKESIAREIFDQLVDKIDKVTSDIYKEKHDILLNSIIKYILIFKYIALNKATQAVYYDIVQYSNYDKTNLERLKNTFFKDVETLITKYNVEFTEKKMIAYILTSDAFAKALFKGIINGSLDFSIEDAINYFFKHMILSEITISADLYNQTINEAFRICETINII